MKKYLLTIVFALLSAALLYAAPSVLKGSELIRDAGSVQLNPEKTATTAAADAHKLRKAPEASPDLKAKKAPAHKADGAYGDWYVFRSGNLTSDNSFQYQNFFGVELPMSISLMRRDDASDPESSQLKIEGLFGNVDFVMDFNPVTGHVSWDNLDLPDVDNPHSNIVPFVMSGMGQYNPKLSLYLNIWLIVVSPNMGFNIPVLFTPDNLPDSRFSMGFTTAGPNEAQASVRIEAIGDDVAKIKYGVFYTANTSIVIDNRYVSLVDVIDQELPGFEIFTLNVGDTKVIEDTHPINRSGAWVLYAVAYDADGDKIRSGGRIVETALREPEKWRSVGMADFTDGQFRLDVMIRSQYYEVELPSWYNEPATWQVPVEESVETPGLYRLVNPYTCTACPWRDSTFKFADPDNDIVEEWHYVFDRSGDNDYYYIFDIRNPDAPWAYQTPTGVTTISIGAEIPQIFNSYSGVFSGNQSFTDPNDFMRTDLRYDTDGRIYSDYCDLEVRLPGYADYSATVSISDTGIELTHLGAAVGEMRFTLLTDEQVSAYGSEVFKMLAQNRSDLITIGTANSVGALSLDAFEPEAGIRYTVAAVTVDATGLVRHEYDFGTFVKQKYAYRFYTSALMEDALESVFGYSNGFYPVDIYVADEAPGKYFVQNPYRTHPLFSSYASQSGDSYLEIDCSDPAHVRIPQFETGLDVGYGSMTIMATASYFEAQGNSVEAIENAGYYGYFSGSEIILPESGLIAYLPVDGRWSWCDASFVIRFPWYRDYSFRIEGRADVVELTAVGADVNAIVYTLVEEGAMTEREIIDAIYSGAVPTKRIEPLPGRLDFSDFDITPGTRYVVGALSVDANNQYCESGFAGFFAELEPVYVGKGMFTDAFLQIVWDDLDESYLASHEVEVYRSETDPGVIYVKEPHSFHPWFTPSASSYLPVVIADPDRVYIPLRSYGLYMGAREYEFCTLSEYYRKQGYGDDEIAQAGFFGTLRDGKVVIPRAALGIRDLSDNFYIFREDSEWPANEAFELVLPPALTGVETVESASAPAAPSEYFDLSGRRVKNPTAGIYIVRRGSSVTKEVVR